MANKLNKSIKFWELDHAIGKMDKTLWSEGKPCCCGVLRGVEKRVGAATCFIDPFFC